MSDDQGGGASRSTDPAAGTSAATDVSLREYASRDLWWLDRHVTAEIAALRRETESANRNAERAIEVAAHEATDRLTAHNGLIEQMQQQQATFAPRESLEDYKDVSEKRFGRIERFQAMLVGGLILLSAIGVANLVKAWTG